VKKKKKGIKQIEYDANTAYMRKQILRGTHVRERGRELDIAVAQEVMGWTVIRPMNPIPGGLLTGVNRLEVTPPPLYLYVTPKGNKKILPHFSLSDRSAFRVFNKLRKHGGFCCVDISADYHYCVDVKIKVADIELPPEDPFHRPEIVVTHEKFPMAMCIAALEAVRYYKKLKEATNELRDRLRGESAAELTQRLSETPTIPRPTAC